MNAQLKEKEREGERVCVLMREKVSEKQIHKSSSNVIFCHA